MSNYKPFKQFAKEIIDDKRKQQNKRDKAIENEYGPGNQPPNKKKTVSKRGGGDFNIEMKIPKEMVNQGVLYGYKKGGQV